MIKFACSKCGQSIRVDDKYAGKKGRCPKCGTAVVVPGRSNVIRFRCEHCGAKIKVPDRYAGRKGKCPTCQKSVVVPGPQREPVEEACTVAIACSMCGQTIARAADSTDQFVECPACGSVLDASSGEAASAPETPAPSGAGEDLYEETPAEPESTSGRFSRRLIVLAGAGAVVAAVVLIAFFWFFRSPGTTSAEIPVARRRSPDVAEAERPDETTTDSPEPIEQPASQEVASPEIDEAVRLRFCPSPGAARRLRVTTQLTISSKEEGAQQFDVTGTQAFTVGLQAGPTLADGAVPITVRLEAIQVKTEMQGTTMGEYDSTRPQSEDDSMAGLYVPFINQRFTMRLSEQGEIIDPGLDELFLAVAADRVEAEDDMMREQLGERSDEAIQHTDQRFGSRRARTLALKKQFEESLILGEQDIRGLLDHLIVPLPAGPVQRGSRWSGPIPVRVQTWTEMPGTYTVAALEEDACTVVAEARRSPEDEPVISQIGSTTVSEKLVGSTLATVTVDRASGWLRRKEQKTALSGRVLRTSAGAPGQGTFSDVTTEVTTTVIPVE